MESKAPPKRAASRFDKLFESIEIEYIAVDGKDADRKICEIVRALLEIDLALSKDDVCENYKEAG